jgi:ferric-dicitrate binding protein FerR (iron transport regulator)
MTKARDQWREMMTARLFGELTEGEGRRLDHHLAGNAQAQMDWAELTEAHEALRTQGGSEATAGLADRLLERLLPALAEDADAVGEIAAAQGPVERCAEGTETWAPAQSGDVLLPGDSLRVAEGARALVRLPDRSELWINAGSLLRFAKRRAGAAVKLISGELLAFMEKRDDAFQIATPHGRVAVVGTVFSTAVNVEHGSVVTVVEGAVRVIAGHAERLIGGGHRQRFRETGLARRERLGRRERQRLEEWTQPLLASASASHRLSTGLEEDRGTNRFVFPSLIGAVLILMIGYAITRGTGGEEPPDTQSAFQAVQSQMASATPLQYEPSATSELTAGMTWPSTTHVEGELFVQRSSSVDLRVRFAMGLHM